VWEGVCRKDTKDEVGSGEAASRPLSQGRNGLGKSSEFQLVDWQLSSSSFPKLQLEKNNITFASAVALAVLQFYFAKTMIL
jgi:hypothetical protein